MKEFYIEHYESCDYCLEIHERTDIGEVEKYELIDKHTMSAYADQADLIHEAYKEQQNEM